MACEQLSSVARYYCQTSIGGPWKIDPFKRALSVLLT